MSSNSFKTFNDFADAAAFLFNFFAPSSSSSIFSGDLKQSKQIFIKCTFLFIFFYSIFFNNFLSLIVLTILQLSCIHLNFYHILHFTFFQEQFKFSYIKFNYLGNLRVYSEGNWVVLINSAAFISKIIEYYGFLITLYKFSLIKLKINASGLSYYPGFHSIKKSKKNQKSLHAKYFGLNFGS